MNKIDTKHPVINQILIGLEPLIDERTAKFIESYELSREKNNKAYEVQQTLYNGKVPYNIKPYYQLIGEVTQNMIKSYERGLVMDFVKALIRYIKTTDTLITFEVNRKNPITLFGVIEREGKRYFFETDIIPAGGYNIQRFHYRYITKTELPSMEAVALRWTNSLEKLRVLENDLERYLLEETKTKEDLEFLQSLTEDQIWKESQYSSWDYTYNPEKENSPSQEILDERKSRYRSEEVERIKNRIRYTKSIIKEYPEKISKVETKLESVRRILK